MLENVTLNKFDALTEHEKADYLWEYGVRVSENFGGKVGYILYQIGKFYVEATYDCQNNTITKLNSFSTATKLGL